MLVAAIRMAMRMCVALYSGSCGSILGSQWEKWCKELVLNYKVRTPKRYQLPPRARHQVGLKQGECRALCTMQCLCGLQVRLISPVYGDCVVVGSSDSWYGCIKKCIFLWCRNFLHLLRFIRKGFLLHNKSAVSANYAFGSKVADTKTGSQRTKGS